MSKKAKKQHQSRKIQPKPIPVAPPRGPTVVSVPKHELAEFKKGRGWPLTLEPDSKSDAPKLGGMVCTAAWKVMNSPETLAQFEKVAADLGNVATLYHGTPATNVTTIAEEGLRPGRSQCMFGSGIYMGPPAKAIGYTGYGRAQYMFQVKAALGRVKECPNAQKNNLRDLQKEGFDSVAGVAGYTASWGGTLRHSENVVYSSDQVLVLKVYEYQRIQYTEPPREHVGTCMLMRKVNATLEAKNRAFADVLSQKVCGRKSSVQMATKDVNKVWVCNDCITANRLKIGSAVKVYRSYGRHPFTETRITEVLA